MFAILQLCVNFATIYREGDAMNIKTKHNPSSIVNKAFHIDFKGYSPLEVDTFLDEIVTDYVYLLEVIQQQQQTIQQLESSHDKYKEKLIQCEGSLQAYKETPTNSDLLKRLARLEALIDQKD